MRRVLLGLAGVLVALVALPPLVYAVFPPEAPELPPAGRRIPVGTDAAVNAIVKGAGPPVVLVHGTPGSAYDWEPLTDALAARGRRVVAYGRVGYGRSDGRTDADYTFEANARELLALLAVEDLRDATLVGWSYGGPVVVNAATRDSSRIGALVLVGTGGPEGDEAREPPPDFVMTAVLTWVGAVPPAGLALQRVSSAQAFSEGPMPAWWLPRLAANFAMPHTRSTWQEEGRRYQPDGMDPAAVALPVLVVHGDDDRLVSLNAARWVHERAPRSELVVVEGGSHMLPITHTEMLADRIAAMAPRR